MLKQSNEDGATGLFLETYTLEHSTKLENEIQIALFGA